jgi:anti-sigma factor RsiW
VDPDEAREQEAERLLAAALLEKLPQHPAPLALKRRLAERFAGATRARRPRRAFFALGAASAVAAAALVVLVPLRLDRARSALAGGAVQEHVAVLRGERPLQIVSSGIHEVKPWFAGKLDFAPAVSFGGDAEFPLRGGAVATFLGRPAACLEFARRAHRISLFVLRADALSFPRGPRELRTVLGFEVALWRDGDLGYALVSDLDRTELAAFAARIPSSGESQAR